jgi:hypothetical protein
MMILLVLMDVYIQNAGYIADVVSWLLVRFDKQKPPHR